MLHWLSLSSFICFVFLHYAVKPFIGRRDQSPLFGNAYMGVFYASKIVTTLYFVCFGVCRISGQVPEIRNVTQLVYLPTIVLLFGKRQDGNVQAP